jgi:hypothetical protein
VHAARGGVTPCALTRVSEEDWGGDESWIDTRMRMRMRCDAACCSECAVDWHGWATALNWYAWSYGLMR